MRTGTDKIVITKHGYDKYRIAFVRNGDTLEHFIGPFRETFNRAMRYAEESKRAYVVERKG